MNNWELLVIYITLLSNSVVICGVIMVYLFHILINVKN